MSEKEVASVGDLILPINKRPGRGFHLRTFDHPAVVLTQ